MKFKVIAGAPTPVALLALAASLTLAPAASAGLIINPIYDTSITSNGNATAIEGAISTAIGTIDALFSNSVTLNVTFTYNPGPSGDLESTNQLYYDVSYSQYKGLLQADSTAHPGNTVLATALANLGSGNDANGAQDLAVAGGDLTMLGIASAGDATININSNQSFSFSRPVSSSQFDLIGGLEHELDEVLGGGGGGSTLNQINDTCGDDPTGFFCNKVGPTDLYRYSAPGTPSFTTSGSATAYLSVNGGATSLVGLNQNSSGDYGDFAPPGGGAGQLIQNAFNSTGQDEAYTTGSPEFAMLESIGWDAATPEPGTALLVLGAGLAFGIWKRRVRA